MKDILTHYTLYMNFEQSKFTHIWIFRKPFDFPLVCLPKEDEEKNEDWKNALSGIECDSQRTQRNSGNYILCKRQYDLVSGESMHVFTFYTTVFDENSKTFARVKRSRLLLICLMYRYAYKQQQPYILLRYGTLFWYSWGNWCRDRNRLEPGQLFFHP